MADVSWGVIAALVAAGTAVLCCGGAWPLAWLPIAGAIGVAIGRWRTGPAEGPHGWASDALFALAGALAPAAALFGVFLASSPQVWHRAGDGVTAVLALAATTGGAWAAGRAGARLRKGEGSLEEVQRRVAALLLFVPALLAALLLLGGVREGVDDGLTQDVLLFGVMFPPLMAVPGVLVAGGVAIVQARAPRLARGMILGAACGAAAQTISVAVSVAEGGWGSPLERARLVALLAGWLLYASAAWAHAFVGTERAAPFAVGLGGALVGGFGALLVGSAVDHVRHPNVAVGWVFDAVLAAPFAVVGLGLAALGVVAVVGSVVRGRAP